MYSSERKPAVRPSCENASKPGRLRFCFAKGRHSLPGLSLPYSKLLYSSAISSSLVSRGLPGQQASA